MEMHNPPHPGEILYGLHMEPSGLTIKEVADSLNVDRKTVSRLIHGHTTVTVEMAMRLAKAFGTSEKLWLGMQQAYDLWHAKQDPSFDISAVQCFTNNVQAPR